GAELPCPARPHPLPPPRPDHRACARPPPALRNRRRRLVHNRSHVHPLPHRGRAGPARGDRRPAHGPHGGLLPECDHRAAAGTGRRRRAAPGGSREDPVPALRVLEGREEPAAVLLRLFTLGAQVPRSLVEGALPSLGVDGARRLGLLETVPADGTVRALFDLAPYSASDDAGQIDWWIASDLSELATGRPLGPEHVLGVGGAS